MSECKKWHSMYSTYILLKAIFMQGNARQVYLYSGFIYIQFKGHSSTQKSYSQNKKANKVGCVKTNFMTIENMMSL